MTNWSGDPEGIYEALGVKRVITASGTTTAYGGSKMRPEIMDVMNKAASMMVNLDDLNRAASKAIADATGAEAGFVSGGSASGLVLQAAAVIAGSDPAKMKQLPDTTGLKNEFIIHRTHRFPYDQCYVSAGAKFVEIGDGRRCHPWEMEAAFTENTAAAAYLFSNFTSRRAIPFPQFCEIAHSHGVPVIVDAASYLPPRSYLKRFTAEGADMVIYSGGKQVRGPQGTGILCGRQDLIDAAFANASPHQFIGRSAKVAKEEIIGLLAALEIFVNEDEEAQMAQLREMSQKVVDALVEVPGLRVTLEHDPIDYLTPVALMKFTPEWRGPDRDDIWQAMADGDPPVYLHNIHSPDELAVDPINLDDEELGIVIERLRETLMG